MNIKIRKEFCCKIFHVCMLLCKTVNYFVSVNMLVFSDVAESKRFESIAPMADGSVESVDVAGCLRGPILKVDVATDTDDLVTQVDQACCTDDLVTAVDQACCTDDLILQVDAACDTSELISTNENVQQQSREKPDPSTTHEQNRAKPDPTTVQEQNRVQPDPTTQPTRGLKRKRNPIVSTEPEILEIDRVLPSCGVTEAEFQQWKPKPLEEEKRALILELDKVLASMRVMTPRRDANQFLEWVVQHFDLFVWSEKPRTDVWKCLERCFPKFKQHFKGVWARENCDLQDVARFKLLENWWTYWPEYNADNTLIVDTEHFRHYYNIRRCCLVVPEELPDNYLVQTLSRQLSAWLWTPYRARYADHICREVPLTSKSLAVYRKFVDLANGVL